MRAVDDIAIEGSSTTNKMDAKLDMITEQLKELPLLREQLGQHQDSLQQLAYQIGLTAELLEDVKKDQSEARTAGMRGAPDEGGYDYRRLAKVKFPPFSGEDPKLWMLRSNPTSGSTRCQWICGLAGRRFT